MVDEFGKTGTGDEDELAGRQSAKLYPVGKALRATFDANNHASLSKDVTGLMLDLAHVPFEPHEFEPLFPPAPMTPRPGWLARIRIALQHGRKTGRPPAS